MTEQERFAFNKLLDMAADRTIMPGNKDLERMKKILFQDLFEYPLEVIAQAVQAHCRTNKFFPMLADIVTQIEGLAEDRAAVAWSLIMKAKYKYKSRRSITFSNPAIHYAIDKMGGWERLFRSITEENEMYKAKDFQRFYKIGEKYAGKIQVSPYYPSDDELYVLRKGKIPNRVIYDVASDTTLPNNEIPALPASTAAWYLVLKTKQEHRYGNNPVKFPSPAIHYAIEHMGGWEELCKSVNCDNEDIKGREFAKWYNEGEIVASWNNLPKIPEEFFDVSTDRLVTTVGLTVGLLEGKRI